MERGKMELIRAIGTKSAVEGRRLGEVAEFLKSQALRGGIFFCRTEQPSARLLDADSPRCGFYFEMQITGKK